MKTHRKPTPIELAIDRATGFARSGDVPIYVTLKCPTCGRTQQTPALESDPEGTTVIHAECTKCSPPPKGTP